MDKIRDGGLYKIIEILGKTFEVRYGYYEAYEREAGEPIPIYPDFLKAPEYTVDGRPFVTAMQDSCAHAKLKDYSFGFCNDCEFYEHGDDFIGVCTCKQNRKNE
ncbi:MAG: hypothetical protein E7673_06280 [Ruminococcaceae bacterium]|nr:hypothetical protein [Oscillospiraceae bacterium]